MAIIYSYPEKTTPAGGDFLVITDSEQPAPNKNRTKSLTIDNLASYVITSQSAITGSGTLNTIAMFTPTGVKIGDSIITQDALGQGVIISGTLNITGNTTFLSTITAGGGTGTAGQVLSSTGTGVEWVDNTATGTVTGTGTTNTLPIWSDGPNSVLGDSQLKQSGPSLSGLYQIRMDNTERFIINKPSSVTSGDPEYLIQQDGNYKVSMGWDDDGAGYGYLYNWAGNGWRFGSQGNNPELTIVTTAGSEGVDIANNLGVNGDTIMFGDLTLEQGLKDGDFTYGTAGQVLSTTGSGQNVKWIDVSGGTVTGTGTTNTLPIWSNGPNGVLGDSGITQTLNANNKITNITLATNGADPNSLSASFGTGGSCRFSTGDSGEFMRLTAEVDGFYKSRFRFLNKVTVDRDSTSVGPSLDVGEPSRTYAAAWFRNGVVVSNNPSGVQVDNTSMVIGGGNNDIVSGSDSCLAVGNNNQILSDSDNSLAVGQGNIIRNDADNCFAVGQSNIIDGSNTGSNSVRSQVLGFDNNLSNSYSSFIAGGDNAVTTGNNAFALGYSHILQGIDSQFAFGENCTGPASGQNTFMMGSALTGSDKSMAVGFRNDTSSYPAIDYPNGLGETKFVVGVGSNGTSNAIIITEGNINRGNPNVNQIPRIILPQQETLEFTSDADATASGIPTGGLYRNGNDLKINFNETAAGGNEGLAYLTPQLLTASAGASGTIDPNYNLVLLSWTGGNGIYTLNLPLASTNTNRLIRITTDGSLANGSGDKIDITATGGETIDGDPSFQISKQYEGLAVFSTGSEWIIVQAKAH